VPWDVREKVRKNNLATAKMLTQWRYKIQKSFARQGEDIFDGEELQRIIHTKPRPKRLFLYKPSKKKVDYVDYTGETPLGEMEIGFFTCKLELLGYIKFVGRRICNE